MWFGYPGCFRPCRPFEDEVVDVPDVGAAVETFPLAGSSGASSHRRRTRSRLVRNALPTGTRSADPSSNTPGRVLRRGRQAKAAFRMSVPGNAWRTRLPQPAAGSAVYRWAVDQVASTECAASSWGGRSVGAPRDTAAETAYVSGDVASAGAAICGRTGFGYSDSPPPQDAEYGSAMGFTDPGRQRTRDGNALEPVARA
jgi:hypothetical protein